MNSRLRRAFTASLRALPNVRGRIRLFGGWAARHQQDFAGYTFNLNPWTRLRWSGEGLPDLLTQHLLLTGIYQEEVLYAIDSLLRPGDVAFDVGTHHGLMAILMASRAGPTGSVHAFEPNPHVHPLIARHAVLNGVQDILRVQPMGIGARESVLPFWAVEGTYAWNSSFTESFAGGSDSVRVHHVPVTTLDTYCAAHQLKPDLIKIDVEGGELAVLKGAKAILEAHHPVILLEMNPMSSGAAGTTPAAIDAFLRQLGYEGKVLTAHSLSRESLVRLPVYHADRHSDTDGLLNVAFLPAKAAQ
jgi:FkbM family methyltransferase